MSRLSAFQDSRTLDCRATRAFAGATPFPPIRWMSEKLLMSTAAPRPVDWVSRLPAELQRGVAVEGGVAGIGGQAVASPPAAAMKSLAE